MPGITEWLIFLNFMEIIFRLDFGVWNSHKSYLVSNISNRFRLFKVRNFSASGIRLALNLISTIFGFLSV